MIATGVAFNMGGAVTRNFRANSNFTTGSVAIMTNGLAVLGANTSYANAIGIVYDAVPPTLSTTKATGANSAQRFVRISCHPFQKFMGRVSSAAASYTAVAAAANGAILTNSTANTAGTVIADTNVGTANYVGGIVVGLTGNNKGYSRVVTATSANTSVTVTQPFDYTIAANDTFLRTFNHTALRGCILTNDVLDILQTAAGETIPSNANVTGGMLIVDVYVDGSKLTSTDQSCVIANETAPIVQVEGIFSDHIFNKLA